MAIIHINDPLLRNAIDGTPHNLPHLPEIPYQECWNHGKCGIGHIYLTFITRIVFNLHRLPTFGERCFDSLHWRRNNGLVEKFFDSIAYEDIYRSVDELNKLYKHTQSEIFNGNVEGTQNFIHGDMIELWRGLRDEYGASYVIAKEKASSDSEIIPVDTDTIDSYGCGTCYSGCAIIKRYVPIKHVLLCNKTVFGLKENEWLILNPDERGILGAYAGDIHATMNDYDWVRLNVHINKHRRYYENKFREEKRLDLFDNRPPLQIEDSRLVKMARFISTFFK
jgi:hypothetical protein